MSDTLAVNQELRNKCAIACRCLLEATIPLERAYPQGTQVVLLLFAQELHKLLSTANQLCHTGTLPHTEFNIVVSMN